MKSTRIKAGTKAQEEQAERGGHMGLNTQGRMVNKTQLTLFRGGQTITVEGKRQGKQDT